MRLDMIDRNCQEFTKLAHEKSIMEENLKKEAYLMQMQAVREAELLREQQSEAMMVKAEYDTFNTFNN